MSITLYGSPTGSTFRAHWMLAEAGLDYEFKLVNLREGAHKTPEYLAINPAGQIPVINIDGFILAESMVIARYLATKYKPELLGATAEIQAKGEQWELWAMLNLQKSFITLAMKVWTGHSDEIAETKAKEDLAKQLPVLEAYLAGRSFIAGDEFTVADINTAVTIGYAYVSGFDLTVYPNIVAWHGRAQSRPAYEQAKNRS